MKTFLALDLSLTATGYVKGGLENPNAHEARGVWSPNGQRGFPRIEWIRRKVMAQLAGVDLVVIEGYSFGSKGRAVFDIAELGGVIRMTLHDLGYPWVEVSPSSLKKYATGKGNAGKADVLVEAVKRLEYQGSDHNEADALWLLEMAMDHYGVIKSNVPKDHRAALEKVQWPSPDGT